MTTTAIATDVLYVLSESRTEGAHLYLPCERLDRTLYERTNKVLIAAGGKWNRKTRSHVFDGDAGEAMEQIILTGEITLPQNFGFFPTPAPVVARLIELAQIEPGMSVLEPSAGHGAIAEGIADATGVPHCYELLDKNVEILKKTFSCVKQADFLAIIPDGRRYDRVVMNPPFAKQADIKHVMHAHKFLNRGGRLVSVMSNSVTFRTDRLTQQFKEFLLANHGTIEPLSDGAFKESGTMVRTVIVVLEASES